MATDIHLWPYLTPFFLEWEIFQTKTVERLKTHILCSVTFFRKSYRLWDKVGKKIVEQGRRRMTIRRMRIAFVTPKGKNTHSEYIILIAFSLQQWLRERFLVLRYTYVSCLVQANPRAKWWTSITRCQFKKKSLREKSDTRSHIRSRRADSTSSFTGFIVNDPHSASAPLTV